MTVRYDSFKEILLTLKIVKILYYLHLFKYERTERIKDNAENYELHININQ